MNGTLVTRGILVSAIESSFDFVGAAYVDTIVTSSDSVAIELVTGVGLTVTLSHFQ